MMIFELSLANTIERLGTLEDCPDGVVDLSATIAHINEYKKVFNQERTDTRSAVVRLTTALYEHLQAPSKVPDNETSSIENICHRLALSILMTHISTAMQNRFRLRDSHLANRYKNPLYAIKNTLSSRYTHRLELDLKSVPYWASEPDSAGIIRASVDISGCACFGITVAYIAEPDEDDEEHNQTFIQSRRLFRRPDRDERPEPEGPVYPYDNNTWRAWYENHEPPLSEDDEERPL
jgi:hypothetical protein